LAQSYQRLKLSHERREFHKQDALNPRHSRRFAFAARIWSPLVEAALGRPDQRDPGERQSRNQRLLEMPRKRATETTGMLLPRIPRIHPKMGEFVAKSLPCSPCKIPWQKILALQ
jgi:hypothetical protein